MVVYPVVGIFNLNYFVARRRVRADVATVLPKDGAFVEDRSGQREELYGGLTLVEGVDDSAVGMFVRRGLTLGGEVGNVLIVRVEIGVRVQLA